MADSSMPLTMFARAVGLHIDILRKIAHTLGVNVSNGDIDRAGMAAIMRYRHERRPDPRDRITGRYPKRHKAGQR